MCQTTRDQRDGGRGSPSLLMAKGVPSAILKRMHRRASSGRHIIHAPTGLVHDPAQRAQDIDEKASFPSKLPS